MINEFVGNLGVLIVGIFLILIGLVMSFNISQPKKRIDSDLDRVKSSLRWTRWMGIAWLVGISILVLKAFL